MAISRPSRRRPPILPLGRHGTLLVDGAITLAVTALVTVMIHEATERGSRPLSTQAYALGVAMALPVMLHRRRPVPALLLSSALLYAYYASGFPGISPTTVLAVPLYSAVLAGHLVWAAGLALIFFIGGFIVVAVFEETPFLETTAEFFAHAALAAAVILLAEVVRSRRALAEETRERLRRVAEEREYEAARRVAEERVRIARDLHDTVAHSMATITVQAGGALQVLSEGPEEVRGALTAIRETSKRALREMGATLNVLRAAPGEPEGDTSGLERLPALLQAVRAAGVPVTLEIIGAPAVPPAPRIDHAAYRILQESLTNVLRHAGPRVRAVVTVEYGSAGVDLEVRDDGQGVPDGERTEPGEGHGLGGMRERAAAVGGTFSAGPGPLGGFRVSARLPVTPEGPR